MPKPWRLAEPIKEEPKEPKEEPRDSRAIKREGSARPDALRSARSEAAGSEAGPLIPAKWIAVPTQRLIAVSVFVAIQALKVTYALAFYPSFGLFLLFTAADILYFWALPLLAIPWLTFRVRITLLQMAAAAALNLFLFYDRLFVFTAIAVVYRSLTGTELALSGRRVNPAEATRNHLLGRYVVSFLPESSASLGADENLCISDEEVYLHLQLNSTWPSFVSLQAKSFDDELFSVNYTSRQLSRLPHKDQSIWLPVKKEGIYLLGAVTDSKTDMAVMTTMRSKGAIPVPKCPKASWDVDLAAKCVGQSVPAAVVLTGIAPLQATLKDGRTLQSGSDGELKMQTVRVPLPVTAQENLQLTLASVKDALGNVRAVGESVKIPAIKPPSANTRDETFALVDKPVYPAITVSGQDGPFDLTYTVNSTEQHVELKAGTTKLELAQPGTYKLKSVAGRVCEGPAHGTITVFAPPAVGIAVNFEQVEDKCAGPTGISAEVSLDGTPPFTVWYRMRSNGRVIEEKQLRTNDMNARVEFKPHSVGTFEYDFSAVADKYRKLDLTGFSTTQTIAELAGANFAPVKTRYCAGEHVTAAAKVQGHGPLSLEYAVDGKKHTVDDLSPGQSVEIDAGVLSGGSHTLRLLGVTDGRGCRTGLDVRSPEIFVRASRPHAAFKTPGTRNVTSAKQTIPLDLSGDAPYHLTYTFNGTPRKVVLHEPVLSVTESGTYILTQFSDSACPGDVDDAPVVIGLLPYPTLLLASSQLPEATVCLHVPSYIDVTAQGKPPFTLFSGGSDAQHTTDDTEIRLQVPPFTLPGQYQRYYWLSDANYDEVTLPVEVTFEVPAAPRGDFVAPKEYTVCEHSAQRPKIPLALVGKPPFTLKFEVQNVKTGTKFTTVSVANSTAFSLDSIYDDIVPGRWVVHLTSVGDASNCAPQQVSGHAVYIEMATAPVLEDPQEHVCVGDHVEATLRGSAPFELEYTFAQRPQKISTGHQFRRLAAAPGLLRMTQVRDAQGCASTVDRTIEVHALPDSHITKQSDFSIHHGDTVELAFEFVGVPPFAFTYTRQLHGKVVDRQTVENVLGHKHSIFTKEDGVYEVVELRDKYCKVVA